MFRHYCHPHGAYTKVSLKVQQYIIYNKHIFLCLFAYMSVIVNILMYFYRGYLIVFNNLQGKQIVCTSSRRTTLVYLVINFLYFNGYLFGSDDGKKGPKMQSLK